jgi:hypothetical protein
MKTTSKSPAGPFLYHKEVYLPVDLRAPIHEGRLRYTPHAQREAQADRYGELRLPSELRPEQAQLVEVETRADGRVVKQLWRVEFDSRRDLVLAVTEGGVVKTVWANLRSDGHRSLDKSRYVKRYSRFARRNEQGTASAGG